MSDVTRGFLAVAAVALFVFAVVAMLLDEYMVAGVSFLGASFAIYYRETRTG